MFFDETRGNVQWKLHKCPKNTTFYCTFQRVFLNGRKCAIFLAHPNKLLTPAFVSQLIERCKTAILRNLKICWNFIWVILFLFKLNDVDRVNLNLQIYLRRNDHKLIGANLLSIFTFTLSKSGLQSAKLIQKTRQMPQYISLSKCESFQLLKILFSWYFSIYFFFLQKTTHLTCMIHTVNCIFALRVSAATSCKLQHSAWASSFEEKEDEDRVRRDGIMVFKEKTFSICSCVKELWGV